MATRYSIVPLDPHAHLFEVACTLADPDPAGQRFRLPAWIPGSYLIREFARHFVIVRAYSGATEVVIAKEAKDVWRAAPTPGPLTVTAMVYAFDLSVRGAYLDASRAYFNGPCVFLCPEGREHEACVVEIEPPAGAAYARWRVATTLPRDGAARWGFGTYRAADYEELCDHPVEIAEFAHVAFAAGGATHDIVISGRHRADLDRIARDLQRVCQWQIDLFGGAPSSRAPFDRYLFQVAAVGDGYGGLEHRTSTSLICKRDELPQVDVPGLSDDYRNFLGLASHEYFHGWNVKRIKPAAFVPYDLTRETYTRLLWAFEGITSYYDDLALVRSGVIERAGYLELLGRTITNVLRTPGRRAQSVAAASFDAWIKYYRQDENTPNAAVSYYAKGAVVALALDLTLRRAGSSLDALMRLLWQRFGAVGQGVPEDGLEQVASELAGRDLRSFFADFVEGTVDPPLAALLDPFGIALNLRPAEGGKDRGGTRGKGQAPRVSLGVKLAGAGEARLQHVFRGGPAERAGLAGGDTLVAIDGIKASAESIERMLRERNPGDLVTVHAFRRDELLSVEVALDAPPADTCFLTLEEASDEVAARREAWLGP